MLTACGGDDEYVPVEETDMEAPTAPVNLEATTVSENSISLSWGAATDNVAVTGYTLYQDNVIVLDNLETTSVLVSDLEEDATYTFYVTASDAKNNESNASNTLSVTTALTPIAFTETLSEMGIFTGTLSEITPAEGVQLYEINSTLFTDYASKQRLIRLPEGKSMEYNGDELLPLFPDNTLIAKTFYYNIDDRDPNLGKQLIETRVFLKIQGSWKTGNYIWNSDQTEATYRELGSIEAISYIDSDGATQNIAYEIPSQQDCATCHNNNDMVFPIGMKLRSMNFNPDNETINENQLDYFINNGLLTGLSSSSLVSTLPDWTDEATWDVFERSRAYMDVNCAHCHQPGGEVSNFDIDFRFETPFDDTGIYANRGEIEARIQSTAPTYRMPQLGRTIVHEEAVAMLLTYLEAIED
ncbi:hypothetical protein ULVI_02725 [Cochleicola gelatinilyticus]|uniref:Fibronectin type-III domain-containing protein n=2 Tax=Cochleicola gelatinilyticus TaxID=1763537 RepID=A0A167IIA4_9FLAO|nr:hypothetical protein ULVI_02725 [Cochleicola gelatinilyticus]